MKKADINNWSCIDMNYEIELNEFIKKENNNCLNDYPDITIIEDIEIEDRGELRFNYKAILRP